MKRRIFLAAAPAAFVGACAAPPSNGFVPPTPASLQQAVINACGFFAELGPLATLIAQFIPIAGVSTTATVLNQLAGQICDAVGPAKSRPGAAAGGQVTVQVNGVNIVGKFVR